MAITFYKDEAFDQYRKNFREGEFVFRQGAKDGDLGILTSGKLSIIKDGYTIALVDKPGAIIGEVALVLGTAHTTGVRASEDSTVVIIPRSKLNDLGRKIPEFSMLIMRTLAERLEQTNIRLAALEDSYDMLYNRMDSTIIASNKMPGLEELRDAAFAAEDNKADWPTFKNPSSPNQRSPLMEKEVICVAHHGSAFSPSVAFRKPQGTAVPWGYEMFSIHLLRTGSMRFKEDDLGITIYTGPEPGYSHLDYMLQEVHVCPVCLFASNDINNFMDARAKMESGLFSIRRSISSQLANDMESRRELAKSLRKPDRLFSPNRDFKEAAVSFEMAMLTARAFLDYDPAMYSNWGFRIVIYNLKLAHLHLNYGKQENAQTYYACALEMIKQHFKLFSGAQYFYAFYLLIALSDKVDCRKNAEKYFERYQKMLDKSEGRIVGRLGAIRDEYYSKAQRYLEK